MITEDQLKDNPKMAALVHKALAKDRPVLAMQFTTEKPYNKYRVADKEDRTYKDGTLFASKREMERWDYLLNLQRAKEIVGLQAQVPFVLQEAFISKQYEDIGELIYVADFVYINISYRKGYEGRKIIEDSKGGMLTSAYKIKKKLMLYRFADYLFFEV